MSEPGYWTTDDAEAANLRAYLLKGGFIIFDDFDGGADWQNLLTQMKRTLPDHYFIRLDVTHPIFQSFFGLKTLNIPHPMLPGIEPVFLDCSRTTTQAVRTDILHLPARVVVTAAAISRRRTAHNIVERLSGANEPPMISRPVRTGRPIV
jgi:hypothetical protein